MLADQLVGADISLPCEVAEGKPAPAVLWYKDNLSLDMETVTIDQDNTLEITNANEGHFMFVKLRIVKVLTVCQLS